MSHLDQIKDEIEQNKALPHLATQVENISDDLFLTLNGASASPDTKQSLGTILQHIRQKQSDIHQRQATYQNTLQNINDSTTIITGGTLTGKALRAEQQRLSDLQSKLTTLQAQYTPTTYPAIGIPSPEVSTTLTNLQQTENDYRSLYTLQAQYADDTSQQNVPYNSSQIVQGSRKIFSGTVPTGTTYTQISNLSQVTVKKGDQDLSNAQVSGITLDAVTGEINIAANMTIKHNRKKIPRDEPITIPYTIRTNTTTTLTGGATINTTRTHTIDITLQPDPKLIEKNKKQEEKKKAKEEKRAASERRKEEKRNQKNSNQAIAPISANKSTSTSTNNTTNTTPNKSSSLRQKTKHNISQITRGTTHALGTALTLPVTAPVQLATATTKAAKQTLQGTIQYGIIGSAKNMGPKTNTEAFFYGATLGVLPAAKYGTRLLNRMGQSIRSGLQVGYADVTDSIKRKFGYTFRTRKGVGNRVSQSVNQLCQNRSYKTPSWTGKAASNKSKQTSQVTYPRQTNTIATPSKAKDSTEK